MLHALAERYFSWAGPARVTDFAWWAEITVGVARKILKTVDLTPVKLDGLDGLYRLPTECTDGSAATELA